MSSQLTLNQFDALTLAEKLEIFGRDLFTAKQFSLIQAVIDFDCYGERFVKVCDLLQVSKASLSGVISSLNYCGVVYTHKTFNQNAFKNVRFSARRLDCILYSHFVDLYTNSYIEASSQETTQEIEETPAQEIEETPAQENTPKRLKPNTLKNYSAKQLAKHLDRLQDVFIDSEKDALYRVEHGAVYVYEADDNAYYFYGKTRDASLSAISHTYRALGI